MSMLMRHNMFSLYRERLKADINGKTLRVTFPGDYTYTVYTGEDGQKEGSTTEMLRSIFMEHKIRPDYKDLTNKSLELYTSKYDACIHDIALNETDLCAGNFWAISNRMFKTAFSYPMEQSKFYLVSFSEEEVDWKSLLSTPFRPFTFYTWVLSFAMVMYMSCAMMIIQRIPNKENSENECKDVIIEKKSECKDVIVTEKNTKKRRIKEILDYFGNSLFLGIKSFAARGITDKSQSKSPSLAEKIIICGFNTFALM